ncbi:MAG: hypothetical protein JWS10_3151 [Cypionkella sp.]|uniref:hypothetical protein n=1 Tax=Cypionkella sp. TaxID=2811411 RepID=UPI0026195302|nr:hypothetical protein [Cypionkella sp.]MDB5660536.1 hypothetical protein [Cypionkella sp.]
MNTAYRIASILIAAGFAMLCQPFSHDLFRYGFPVLLVGVILFMVLDHIPERRPKEIDHD